MALITRRVVQTLIGSIGVFAAVFFIAPHSDASFGGLLSAKITSPNEITVYYIDTISNNTPDSYSNLSYGLAGRNIIGAHENVDSDHIVLELDGGPLAPNTTGKMTIDNTVTYAGGGGFIGATINVEDGQQPSLGTVTLDDRDDSGDLNGNDQLVFWFTEPMDKTTVTAENADDRLLLTNDHTFGSVGGGMAVSWNTNGTILRITLGADTTITAGDTVGADSPVTDITGNMNNTPAPIDVPVTATVPRTLYFNGAVSGDWSTLGNWWNDSGATDPAASLPTPYDNVVIQASLMESGGLWIVYANSMIVEGEGLGLEDYTVFPIQGHVLNGAQFTGLSALVGNLVGDTIFSGMSFAGYPFYGPELIFSASSITGAVSFIETTANYGTIIGNATFSGSYGNAGLIIGDAEFNDETSNPGVITGNAIFRDGSFNGGFGIGVIEGNADVYYPSENPIEGTVYGVVTYHGYGFVGGTGTEEDPYLIETCSQLQAMNENLSAHYKLISNIDCSDSASWNPNVDEWEDGIVEGTLIPDSYGADTHTDIVVENNGYKGFLPIGNGDTPFTGSLDGDGYSISNLWIFRKTTNYQGLFGKISAGSVIDLELENSSIVGAQYTGGLIGYLDGGTLSHVTVSNTLTRAYLSLYGGGMIGFMSPGDVSYSSVDGGEVHGSGNVIGGFVGFMDGGTISHSSASATVDGGLNIGGFVGEMDGGTITDSHATGNVESDRSEYYLMKTGYNAGGFVGYMAEATIATSWATGNVIGSGSNVGGFAGYGYNPSISYSYATGDVVAGSFVSEYGTIEASYVGGFIGAVYFPEIHDSYATGDVSADQTVGAFAGYVGIPEVKVDNVYATGAVTGSMEVGGLIGRTDDEAPATDSFWNIQTTGQESSFGGIGKTTTEMKNSSLYTDQGWDFETVWARANDLNSGYPYFHYQEFELSDSDTTAPVLSVVHAIPATVSIQNAIFTFTTTEACSYNAGPVSATKGSVVAHIDTVVPDANLQVTFTGLQAGGTYLVSFTCTDESSNQSNELTIGPFSIPAERPATTSGGYSFGPVPSGTLAALGVKTVPVKSQTTSNTPLKNGKAARTLKLGMTGDDVTALQKKLNALGFTVAKTGVGSIGKEGKNFGKKTRLAVIAFQKSKKLKADGIVGSLTLKALGLE